MKGFGNSLIYQAGFSHLNSVETLFWGKRWLTHQKYNKAEEDEGEDDGELDSVKRFDLLLLHMAQAMPVDILVMHWHKLTSVFFHAKKSALDLLEPAHPLKLLVSFGSCVGIFMKLLVKLVGTSTFEGIC